MMNILPNQATSTSREVAAANSLNAAAVHRDQGDQLEVLYSLRTAAGALREAIEQQVVTLREQGATWSQVGAALDMSKQAAQQRYSALTDPR